MALSSELIKRCRDKLLQCSEFKTDDRLRSVFVTNQLRIFRDDLPECSDRSDRVNQTLDYLILQRSRGSRPVLSLFIAQLRDRREKGDTLRSDLEWLRIAVEQELKGKAIVPFVIVAMNDSEATELMSEEVFQDNPNVAPVEHSLFQEFRQALEEHGVDPANITLQYEEKREQWKPLACPDSSIDDVISETLQHINSRHRNPRSFPHLLPEFFSRDFVLPEDSTEEDIAARRRILRQLERSGGIVIVDAVSMFHPTVKRSISRSDIGSYRLAAIVVISPVSAQDFEINRLIEQTVDEQMEAVFTRFDADFDHLCEIGAGDSRAFKRWLFTALERTGIRSQETANPAVLERIERERGETPSGYGPADFMKLGGER